MQEATGRIYTEEEVNAMQPAEKAKCHPLPATTKVDTVRKLQMGMAATDRANALKALNRKANKVAKLARRRNRSK